MFLRAVLCAGESLEPGLRSLSSAMVGKGWSTSLGGLDEESGGGRVWSDIADLPRELTFPRCNPLTRLALPPSPLFLIPLTAQHTKMAYDNNDELYDEDLYKGEQYTLKL